MPTIRLLPFETADGPTNMAADEALLLSAADGSASLRFYSWSPATLSLGYFQSTAARFENPRLASLPWVRRASGGATLVHDQEITYALALPTGSPWHDCEPWMPRFHEILRAALESLGFFGTIQLASASNVQGEVLCFQRHTVGDLLCRGVKIGGSAQRKHRRGFLQHGSLVLSQSQHTPELPGLRELIGRTVTPSDAVDAVSAEFMRATGWPLEPGGWTATERETTAHLAREKFGSAAWNEKR
jgi:lipoate-protein ligase A